MSKGVLFGLGNPLLDICASVDADYLKKYELKPFDAILAEDKHQEIFKDFIDRKPEYLAGGSTQNSIRVSQWMLGTPQACTYCGSVGKDENATRLQDAASKAGVNVQYHVDGEHPTGTCAVLVCDKDRSLVTNLGAANHYKIDHLKKDDVAALVTSAKLYYISGFFLTVSPPSALHVASHAAETGKPFVLSLAAPFICQFFSDPLTELLPFTDYVVGNEHEAMAFGEKWGFGKTQDDLPEIGKKLCALPKKNTNRPRTVIFTQGDGDTLVISGDKVLRFPVIPCAKEDIVDLNGAGDAWLGGFLAYLVQDAPLEKCVAAAMYAANVVIQRPGCTFPEQPDFPKKE